MALDERGALAELVDLFDSFRAGGYGAVRGGDADSPLSWFYRAVVAYGEGERDDAAAFAATAAEREPGNVVFGEAARWLARTADARGIYDEAGAFEAFIRGGGNVGLYDATSERLRRIYGEYDSIRLLDIGVGDGRALLPALTDQVVELDLLEPSGPLLAVAAEALRARGIAHRAFGSGLQELAAGASATGPWQLAQATFALQSIDPAERSDPLRWLAARTERLLVVEFDVPRFDGLYAPARVEYVVERLGRGLAEYGDDRELVAQGFVIPIVLGSFDPTAARTNYEQPIADWVAELREAGFAEVTAERLYPFWWADACLVDAVSRADA